MTRRGLWLNPFSGMAGDMFLGALLDLGLPFEALEERLRTLPLRNFRLERKTVMQGAVRATKLDVVITCADGSERREERGDAHDHPHGHLHDHPHGHSYTGILDLIARSGLTPPTRARASEIFRTLATAEARVHGIELERVHFHEVGAVALELLGVDEVVSDPIGVGTGTRAMAHGTLPLPAPATAEILAGLPVTLTGVGDELVTPTGAAILRCTVSEFRPRFEARILAVGYGAGSTPRADPPNVVRAMLYERDEAGGEGTETIAVLETQVDDTTPETIGYLRERLEAAGALDVLVQPVQMKKNRPGHLISVHARPEEASALEELLFRETSTLGVRRGRAERRVLRRETVEVATPDGPVRVKVAYLGDELLRASPELDDCARIARATGRPLVNVMRAAERLYRP